MFSLSKLNLQFKKNSEIVLCDSQKGPNFSLICLFELSPSSDTGCLTLIEQNNKKDGNIKIRKLIWISDSIVSALTINPTCDWVALAIRGGAIWILPIGTLMSRAQKKCDGWSSNDVTHLTNKLKSKVSCMKWWTTRKGRNLCLIGSDDGNFVIVNLANGNTLFTEKFTEHISNIDLLHSIDYHLSYCIITTKSGLQWKLLLEEDADNEPVIDIEFGFEAIEYPQAKSSSILSSKVIKKSKEYIVNEAYLPTKLHQFPQSIHLKSQQYNGKYFLGAYDRVTGKYKLFECTNLELSIFEYQLPLGAVNITVTEDLIYLVISTEEMISSGSSTAAAETAVISSAPANPGDIMLSDLRNNLVADPHVCLDVPPSSSSPKSFIHPHRNMKLVVLMRHYCPSHVIYDGVANKMKLNEFNSNSSGLGGNSAGMAMRQHMMLGASNINSRSGHKRNQSDKSFYKRAISTVLSKSLIKALLVEFELPNISTNDSVLNCINLSSFFNFNQHFKSHASPPTSNSHKTAMSMASSISTIIQASSTSYTLLESTSSSDRPSSTKQSSINSRWLFKNPKPINPFIIIGTSGVSICYMSQCVEDKFINHLLADEIKKADWLGTGLRLDIHALYHHTAWLLSYLITEPSETVTRTTKSLIIEYLDLAAANMTFKVSCLTNFLSPDNALSHFLSLLPHIQKMSPNDKACLSNTLIILFGRMMSEAEIRFADASTTRIQGTNKYSGKFRGFVTSNCFFNELKAAKLLVQFGLVDEAFFVAKEKGCVLELFTYLMENKYSTNWASKLENTELQTKFTRENQDYVLRSIGLEELEIICRTDSSLVRYLAEFLIRELFTRWTYKPSITPISFRTATHLCSVFNPFGPLLDTIYRIIYSNTATSTMNQQYTKQNAEPNSELSLSSLVNFQSLSITNNTQIAELFSQKSLKLNRELGPSLILYCLLVIFRDKWLLKLSNQQSHHQSSFSNSTYFIHLYNQLLSVLNGPLSNQFSDDESGLDGSFNSDVTLQGASNIGPTSLEAMRSSLKTTPFDQILRLISQPGFSDSGPSSRKASSSNYYSNRYWDGEIPPEWRARLEGARQLLELRDCLCVCVSVFEMDLFQEDDSDRFFVMKGVGQKGGVIRKHLKHHQKNMGYLGNSPRSMSKKKCQIHMMGFEHPNGNNHENGVTRVLMLPKDLEFGYDMVRQVCLGRTHALILCESGALYATGDNSNGQLGLGKISTRSNDQTQTNKPHHSGNAGISIFNPCLVPLDLQDEVIISISAGDFHSGALLLSMIAKPPYSGDENNADLPKVSWQSRIVTWGWNVHGQLGIGSCDDCFVPTSVSMQNFSNDEYPIQLEMGRFHSLILTNQGCVYSFGNNSYGQLGIVGIQKSSVPVKIETLPADVSVIGTRYCHSVCATTSNQLFNWGVPPLLWEGPVYGRMSYEQVCTPMKIQTNYLLDNQRITKIKCAMTHTVILTDTKKTYCYGNNLRGEMGQGNRREYIGLCELSLPQLADYIIADDCASISMSITDRSTFLYIWGNARHPVVIGNIKNKPSDTLRPTQLAVYPHIDSTKSMGQTFFGVDSYSSGHSTILNKHQLLVVFLNFSDYLDRSKLISMLWRLKEVDLIADYFLMNDMAIESFFWRLKSLTNRIQEHKKHDMTLKNIGEDIKSIFLFYIKLVETGKCIQHQKSLLSMIVGFFKRQNCLWDVFESIILSGQFMHDNIGQMAELFTRYELHMHVSGVFQRELLIRLLPHRNTQYTRRPSNQGNPFYLYNSGGVINYDNITGNRKLPGLQLTCGDIDRLQKLIKGKWNADSSHNTSSSSAAQSDISHASSIYETIDDYRVVQFTQCHHAYQVTHFKEYILRHFIDKLRRMKSTSNTNDSSTHNSDSYSVQAVQRLYSEASVFPECVECLTTRIF